MESTWERVQLQHPKPLADLQRFILSRSMEAPKILIQTIRVFFSAWKPLLPIILLTQFTLLSLLFLANIPFSSTTTHSFNITMASIGQKSPKRFQVTSLPLCIRAAAVILSCVTLSVLSTATAHVSTATYSGKKENVTLRDVLLKIKGGWKETMLTQLYTSMLFLGFFVCLLALLAMYLYISSGSSLGSVVGFKTLIFVGALVAVFLDAALSVGMAALTLEKGCSWLKVFGRVEELVGGREMEVFNVGVILWTATGYTFVGCSIMKGNDELGLGFATLVTCIGAVMYVLRYVAYTILYRNCVEAEGIKWEGQRMLTGVDYSMLLC